MARVHFFGAVGAEVDFFGVVFPGAVFFGRVVFLFLVLVFLFFAAPVFVRKPTLELPLGARSCNTSPRSCIAPVSRIVEAVASTESRKKTNTLNFILITKTSGLKSDLIQTNDFCWTG
jgi:hypothetical protein